MTPKEIAKRIKAKGLQKLRWYCQMCQKQCRDENGFKCHTMSESHIRMMKVYAENPDSFQDEFSREFEKGFMDLVKRRWRTKRVFANKVYNEYIQDRHHMHMNATQWRTLTEFVKYLGRTGKCEIDETPKGWYIKYIDRDPDAIARQEALKKKAKMDEDDEIKLQKRIEAQMQAAQQIAQMNGSMESGEESKEENEGSKIEIDESKPITLNLSISLAPQKKLPASSAPVAVGSTSTAVKAEIKEEAEDKKRKRPSDEPTPAIAPEPKKARLSALDEIKLQEEKKKDKMNRKPYWLFPGIIVKILNKTVGDGKFYKQKAVVLEVQDLYLGIVKVLDNGPKLLIDQRDLETVIPNIGGKVLIVNGAYRGEQATMVDIDIQNYKVKVSLDTGPHRGEHVEKAYEDICKLATENIQPTQTV